MTFVSSDNERGKKIIMKASILKPILISCFEGAPFSQLISTISNITFLENNAVKKYLFYMIEFNLITYSGKLKSFIIAKNGISLLLQIELMKSKEKLSTDQIFLQINE